MADTITLEDGMLVTRTAITLADGSNATRISVPIVTAARTDTLAPADSAQIQIGQGLSSLPTGWGVTAITHEPYSLANTATAIKAALKAVPGTITDNESAYFSRYTEKYLSTLSSESQVSVTTFSPITASNLPTDRIVLSGTAPQTVAIVDLSQTDAKSMVAVAPLFSLVTGEGTVSMLSDGAVAIGDDASQAFINPNRGGTVYAGGGNDTLEFGFGLARIDSLFHGGTGFDTLYSDGSIEQHAGYVLVKGRGVTLKLVNVERIVDYKGQYIDINVTTEQKAVATLYQNILGRQADVGGFEYWDNQLKAGQSLGQVAITMTRSTESGNTLFNGNTSHDLDTLYNVILKRPTDPIGKAYWSAQIDQGLQTLEQVAQGFVTSNELTNAYLQQTDWNFLV